MSNHVSEQRHAIPAHTHDAISRNRKCGTIGLDQVDAVVDQVSAIADSPSMTLIDQFDLHRHVNPRQSHRVDALDPGGRSEPVQLVPLD